MECLASSQTDKKSASVSHHFLMQQQSSAARTIGSTLVLTGFSSLEVAHLGASIQQLINSKLPAPLLLRVLPLPCWFSSQMGQGSRNLPGSAVVMPGLPGKILSRVPATICWPERRTAVPALLQGGALPRQTAFFYEALPSSLWNIPSFP